tara:strand:+ start:23212 stop:23895 length:684 start_codon:yes stop_codon:yes gene_type:complete
MKTKTKLIIGIVVAACVGLFAYNKVNAEEVSGSFSLGHDSDIGFRGVAGNTSAIQGSMGLGVDVFGIDFSVGAFTNIKQDYENETQLSLETSVSLLDNIETAVGIITYDDNHVVGDATELYVDLGAEFILSPSVRIYYNTSEAVATYEGRVSQGLNIGEQIGIEAIGTLGNTSIADQRATYYSLEAVGTYQLQENTDLFVGIDYTELQDVNLEAPDVAVTVGITHSF